MKVNDKELVPSLEHLPSSARLFFVCLFFFVVVIIVVVFTVKQETKNTLS